MKQETKEKIETLANDYAKYSSKVSKTSDYGNCCEDITPRGCKAASTKKYNKFADACEDAGLSLKEQTAILKKYIYSV